MIEDKRDFNLPIKFSILEKCIEESAVDSKKQDINVHVVFNNLLFEELYFTDKSNKYAENLIEINS
jgi:hypothetical protein